MLRHWRLRQSVLLALATVLLAPLPGCNRNDEALPPVVIETPPPAPPVRGVIAQTSFRDFRSGAWVGIPIPITDRGVLDVTVDWTWDDTWMYVYFGDTECGYVALAGATCPFLIASERKGPKPRKFVTDLLDPDTYYIYLYNVPRDPTTGVGSDRTERVSIVVGLTVGLDEQAARRQPVELGRPTVISPPQL